jgi:hypothetical protein
MRRTGLPLRLLLCLAAGACFSPRVEPGLECGPGGSCPPGQERRRAEEAERARQADEEARLRAAEEEREAARSSRGRGLRIAGIASAATGVAVVALATYFGLRAGDIEAEIEEKAAMQHASGGSWTAELDDLVDDGEAAERNMIVFSVVGGVAIAGGVTMYLLGVRAKSRAREEAVTLVPSITPDGAGLFATGRF